MAGKFDTLDDGRPAVSTGTLVVARDGCPAKSSPTESLEEVTKAFARQAASVPVPINGHLLISALSQAPANPFLLTIPFFLPSNTTRLQSRLPAWTV